MKYSKLKKKENKEKSKTAGLERIGVAFKKLPFYRIKQIIPIILGPLISLSIAMLIGAVIMAAAGQNPLLAYKELFMGGFGSKGAWLRTLRWSTPIIITGLAAMVGFRSGIFNIGIEGSLWIGGFCAAITGIYVTSLPSYLHIPLCLIVGMLAGGLWSLIPGFFKAKYNVNEVVFTVMSNTIAILLVRYLILNEFFDEAEYYSYGQTVIIQESAWLPWLNKTYEVSSALIISVVLVVVAYFLFKRSVWGYETTITGKNSLFAKFSGINGYHIALLAFVISGALAGLAGGTEVLGNYHRIHEKFSASLGFTGISAALMGRLNPIGVFITSLFLAGLTVGGQALERNVNVSREIVLVIQALILFFITAEGLYSFINKKRKSQVKE